MWVNEQDVEDLIEAVIESKKVTKRRLEFLYNTQHERKAANYLKLVENNSNYLDRLNLIEENLKKYLERLVQK